MWSVSRAVVIDSLGAMDSSEAMVLMGMMEKAEKHGVLDEYYRQVKSGEQQDEDTCSWVSSEDRFDVPKITPKEYRCQILRIMIPGLQFQKIVIALLNYGPRQGLNSRSIRS